MSPAILAVLLALAAPPAVDPPPDTVVVCPEQFRTAMKPWFDLRASQGHHVAVLPNLGSAAEIRDRIQLLARRGGLRFVVLVGGADAAMYRDPAVHARSVPMHYAMARVNVKWGSTPTIPTDNWYAQNDQADDERPTPALAIGRLPAESADELRTMVKKIVDHERSTDFGPWRQRMNFVAGVGNFGPLADRLLESVAGMFITENIPAEYHVSMTYSNWRSPYCPDPRRFHAATLERLDEESLFWIYMGHSAIVETAWMEVPGGNYPILRASDMAALGGTRGRPIALFLSCYAGALDARQRCLAGAMVAAPGGPVAVVAGTRVTMPYAMTIMATNLTDEFFRGGCETLGEAVLHAKQKMLQEPAKNDARRAMLDSIAAAISPSSDLLAAERAEHVLLFNLVGDPLLTLRHPKSLEVRAAKRVPAGGDLEVSGSSPFDGRATVELVLHRGRLPGPPPSREAYPASDRGLTAFDAVYQRANQRRLKAVDVEIRGGRFQARLDVPAEATGACAVCVFAAGKNDMAMGSSTVEVVRPSKPGSILSVIW